MKINGMDLRNKDIVVLRNGSVGVVMGDEIVFIKCNPNEEVYSYSYPLSNYYNYKVTQNMSYREDIVSVKRDGDDGDCIYMEHHLPIVEYLRDGDFITLRNGYVFVYCLGKLFNPNKKIMQYITDVYDRNLLHKDGIRELDVVMIEAEWGTVKFEREEK